MLQEFPNVRQEPGAHRRLFCDSTTDLYAWYDRAGGTLIGFQVVYFEDEEQKAFTWTESEGYHHNVVDGWDSGRLNQTPLLVPGGDVEPQALLDRLTPLMDLVDPSVRTLVLDRIGGYSG